VTGSLRHDGAMARRPAPTGLTKDAGWQIGVSRTLAVPVDAAWRFLTSTEGARVWLGDGATIPSVRGEPIVTADGSEGELRSLRDKDRVRILWRPAGRAMATVVQLVVVGDDTKTSIRFHQERLANERERAAQRAHWQSVLDRIAAELAPPA
jgi:uncharacterized protein YndB with AHSA1/START domain